MSKTEQDKSYFLAFCIEQFKQSRGITGAKASEIIFSSGIAEYLTDNFEVLHTQSRQWLMEEIDEMLQQKSIRNASTSDFGGTKRELNKLEVTQQNLHLFLPGKIANVAQFYAEDHGCTMFEAICHLYASPFYERLADESTKLWHLGAVGLYELYSER